jgi:hypothetical protein
MRSSLHGFQLSCLQIKIECMNYKKDGREIRVGDEVLVEGNVSGVVVCDFEKWDCVGGYESWLTKDKLVSGDTLSSGVMIKTAELGFLHYAEEDDDILLIKHSGE